MDVLLGWLVVVDGVAGRFAGAALALGGLLVLNHIIRDEKGLGGLCSVVGLLRRTVEDGP